MRIVDVYELCLNDNLLLDCDVNLFWWVSCYLYRLVLLVGCWIIIVGCVRVDGDVWWVNSYDNVVGLVFSLIVFIKFLKKLILGYVIILVESFLRRNILWVKKMIMINFKWISCGIKFLKMIGMIWVIYCEFKNENKIVVILC